MPDKRLDRGDDAVLRRMALGDPEQKIMAFECAHNLDPLQREQYIEMRGIDLREFEEYCKSKGYELNGTGRSNGFSSLTWAERLQLPLSQLVEGGKNVTLVRHLNGWNEGALREIPNFGAGVVAEIWTALREIGIELHPNGTLENLQPARQKTP